MEKSEIKFIKEKEYKFLRELNRGGFGQAILIKDETIDENFVCKKYSPYYAEDKETYFKNFVQEIKLLHVLSHKNVVRVFNYYLYPDKHTGYILMEYVDGADIQEYLKSNPDKINDIFIQTIQGFRHLEELKILHRDIRPQNIMINDAGIVKIIDFGFGKQLEFQNENFDKSISLNWRYTPPSEFGDRIYDFKTELYFVGKLFEEIIRESGIESFGFTKVLNRMILSNYDSRIASFFDVDREVLSSKSSTIEFDQWDKRTYLEFANSIIKVYAKIYSSAEYISEINTVIKNLEDAYNSSMLEDLIQNNALIAKCFVKGNYTIYIKQQFYVYTIGNFIKFFKFQPVEKQKIILNNIWQRLDTIDRVYENPEDDLPF